MMNNPNKYYMVEWSYIRVTYPGIENGNISLGVTMVTTQKSTKFCQKTTFFSKSVPYTTNSF